MAKAKDIFERLRGSTNQQNHEQWKVVAMCILAATTFWFFSALNKPDYTTTINYPIKFNYSGGDSLVVLGELPKDLRINVTGGGWNLVRKSLGMGTKPLDIRLNNPTEVKYLLGSALEPEIDEQVKSFSLNSILTDTLHINIDRKATRTLPVALNQRSLVIASGHVLLGPVMLSPDSVRLIGPSTILSRIPDTLYIDIDEDNISSDFEKRIPIAGDWEKVDWSPQEIEVRFRVDPLIEKSFLVPLEKRNFPQGSNLAGGQTELEVRFQVPASYADSVGLQSINIYVDYRQLSSDSSVRPRIESISHLIQHLQIDTASLAVTQ